MLWGAKARLCRPAVLFPRDSGKVRVGWHLGLRVRAGGQRKRAPWKWAGCRDRGWRVADPLPGRESSSPARALPQKPWGLGWGWGRNPAHGGEGRRLCEQREDFLFWRPEAARGLYAQARAALGAFGNLGCWESGPGGKGRNPQRGHLPPRCPRTGLGRGALRCLGTRVLRTKQHGTHLDRKAQAQETRDSSKYCQLKPQDPPFPGNEKRCPASGVSPCTPLPRGGLL